MKAGALDSWPRVKVGGQGRGRRGRAAAERTSVLFLKRLANAQIWTDLRNLKTGGSQRVQIFIIQR